MVTSVKRGHYYGVTTPNYFQKKRSGAWLPLNPYTRWDYSGEHPLSKFTLSYNTSCHGVNVVATNTHTGLRCPAWLWGDGGVQNTPDPWEGFDTDALILAALANVLPNLDVGTTLVELEKTVDMVVHARKSAADLIRGALSGGKRTAKSASNAWPEWKYGWEQLGRDIGNVYGYVKNPSLPGRVTGQSGDSDTSEETVVRPFGWTTGAGTTTYNVSSDRSVRAHVIAQLKGKTLNYVMDPLITSWEIIPYSFVADWFVNIGTVLAAWKVLALVNRVSASLGAQVTVTSIGTIEVTGPGSSQLYFNQAGSTTCYERYVMRKRIPAYIPALIPSLTVHLSSARILTGAALLGQRIL
jgi:hypothetical protein